MQKKLTLTGIILAATFLGLYFLAPIARSDQQFTAVSPKEALALIERHNEDDDFVILDIRTPGEYNSGHLKNSILIDYYSEAFKTEVSRLDKEKTYLVHCRSGNRSTRSMGLFKKLKFQKIYHLSSGINGWKSEGLPLVK